MKEEVLPMEATVSDNTQMKTVVYDDAIVRAFSVITIVWVGRTLPGTLFTARVAAVRKT